MRNSVVLASAAVIALVAGSVMSSPATAFAGLSDKQADEISEFIKCKTFLLKGDLASFEADPDCGHGPVAIDLKSMGSQTGPSTRRERDNCHEWTPEYGRFSVQTEGGDEYCPAY